MSRTPKVIPFPGADENPLVLRADWLHEGQREVYDSPARFKVVVCGRQWGKTSLAALTCVEEAAVRGGKAWWVSPHYKEGDHAWEILLFLCKDIPGVQVERRPHYRVHFPSGGSVQVHSADNPDSLRGATLSGLVMDEAAKIDRQEEPATAGATR